MSFQIAGADQKLMLLSFYNPNRGRQAVNIGLVGKRQHPSESEHVCPGPRLHGPGTVMDEKLTPSPAQFSHL